MPISKPDCQNVVLAMDRLDNEIKVLSIEAMNKMNELKVLILRELLDKLES